MIFVVVAYVVHFAAEEEDAQSAYAALGPGLFCVGLFMLKGIEGHAAVLEAYGDAVGLLNEDIQEIVRVFGVGVAGDVHDDFLARQAHQHIHPRAARGNLWRLQDGREYLAGPSLDWSEMQCAHIMFNSTF